MKHLTFALIASAAAPACAQGPEVTAWIVSSTVQTGYGGIETNVQQVDYSPDNVYVACTCIPGYDIGPWAGNPNTPANQNFVFKITRHPVENTGTKVATPLGHIGTWTNGVSIFNAKDAASYNNQGVWHQDAIVVEGASFDECLGHPAPNGEYHNHLNPTCLYDDLNYTVHSPIVGYAFDGFPIYGAYGFANADGSGGIVRIASSYQLRNITTRTILPDGSAAPSAGPNVSATYPLGYYIEDYEYVPGSGALDAYNGRFCTTPEYPAGTYAYFVTLDANGDGAYPYVIGPAYYGTVQAGNTGPASGHNTISEAVTTYAVAGIEDGETISLEVYPNPVDERLFIKSSGSAPIQAYRIVSAAGTVLAEGTDTGVGIDVSIIANGSYFLIVSVSGVHHTIRWIRR